MSVLRSSSTTIRSVRTTAIAVAVAACAGLLSAGSAMAATVNSTLALKGPGGGESPPITITLKLNAYTLAFSQGNCSPLAFTGPQPPAVATLDSWANTGAQLSNAVLTDFPARLGAIGFGPTNTYTFTGAKLVSIQTSSGATHSINGEMTYTRVVIRSARSSTTTTINCSAVNP